MARVSGLLPLCLGGSKFWAPLTLLQGAMSGWKRGGSWIHGKSGRGDEWQPLDPSKAGGDRSRWDYFKQVRMRVAKSVAELSEVREAGLMYTATPAPVKDQDVYDFLEKEIFTMFREGGSFAALDKKERLAGMKELRTWFKDQGWTKGAACIHTETNQQAQNNEFLEGMMERSDKRSKWQEETAQVFRALVVLVQVPLVATLWPPGVWGAHKVLLL